MCLHLSPLSEKDSLAFCKINIIFGRNCPLIYKWFRHIAMRVGDHWHHVLISNQAAEVSPRDGEICRYKQRRILCNMSLL